MSLLPQFPEIVEIENAIRNGYSCYDTADRELAKNSVKNTMPMLDLNKPAQFVEPPAEAECAERHLATSWKLFASIREQSLDALRACFAHERTIERVSTFISEIARMFPENMHVELLTDLVDAIESESLVEAPVVKPVLYEVPAPEVMCIGKRTVSASVRRSLPSRSVYTPGNTLYAEF